MWKKFNSGCSVNLERVKAFSIGEDRTCGAATWLWQKTGSKHYLDMFSLNIQARNASLFIVISALTPALTRWMYSAQKVRFGASQAGSAPVNDFVLLEHTFGREVANYFARLELGVSVIQGT